MKDRTLIGLCLFLFFLLMIGGSLKAFGQSGSRHDAVMIRGDKIVTTDPADGYILIYDSDGDTIYWGSAGAADDLGNHTATQDLNLADWSILAVGELTADTMIVDGDVIKDFTGTNLSVTDGVLNAAESALFDTNYTYLITGLLRVDTIILGNDTSYADHILSYLVRLEVHNATGSSLGEGVPVHISGATGDIPNVRAASASSADSMPAVGLMEYDLANGDDGYVIVAGKVGDLNTSAYNVADELYVAMGGGLTTTKPDETNLIQKVGIVTRDNAAQGDIYVTGANRSNDVPNIASAYYWVGNASAVATAVTMSGDATMDNAGAVTIADQTIKPDYIDTTGEDFVFDDAYRGTSEESDSQYVTKAYVDGGTDAGFISATLTEEEVEDFAGGMLGGTETRITVTYEDGTNDIDFVVDDMNDDVPESGDFGAAQDLDADGGISDADYGNISVAEGLWWLDNQVIKPDLIDTTGEDFVFYQAFKGTSVEPESAFVTWGFIDDSAQAYGDDLGDHTATEDVDMAGFGIYDVDSINRTASINMRGTSFDLRNSVDATPGVMNLYEAKDNGTDFMAFTGNPNLTETWALQFPPASGAVGKAIVVTGLSAPTVTAGWGYPDSADGGAIRSETAKWADSAAATILKSYTNPTVDAEGEISWDSDDDNIRVFDGSVIKTIPTNQDIDALIFAPDGVNDQIPIFHVDADKYPFGIKLVNVQISLPADAAYSMVFEEWAGDPIVAQNDIETVTTGSGDSYMEVRTGDIDDSEIDADDYIFLDIPATDVDWIHVKVVFYVEDGD